MSGCIYYIRHKENGKGYVGQHGNPDPKIRWGGHKNEAKKGCLHLLHRAIHKDGSDAFTWEVLGIYPVDALTNMEGYWAEQLETYKWDYPGGYNMIWCSESPRLGIKQSSETREKIRQGRLGKRRSPETIEKMRQAASNQSTETREKKRQGRLGVKASQETIQKMREAGKKASQETREKMRKAQLGKKASPETREKLRQVALKREEAKRASKHEFSGEMQRS